MNKKLIVTICIALLAAITVITTKLLQNNGIVLNTSTIYTMLTLTILLAICLLNTTIRTKLQHVCCDLDWAEVTSKFYNNIPEILPVLSLSAFLTYV